MLALKMMASCPPSTASQFQINTATTVKEVSMIPGPGYRLVLARQYLLLRVPQSVRVLL